VQEQVEAEQKEKKGITLKPAGQGVDWHKEGGVEPAGAEGEDRGWRMEGGGWRFY
jgi:hypothetical protein